MILTILSLAILFALFVFALTYTRRWDDRHREEQMGQIQRMTKQRLEHWLEQDNAL